MHNLELMKEIAIALNPKSALDLHLMHKSKLA